MNTLNVGKFGIGVRDVIFPKGKLHAINHRAQLLVSDNIVDDVNTKVTKIAPLTPYAGVAYFPECFDGGLIAVTRDFDYSGIIIKNSDNPLPATNGFKVYKLESMNSNWVQVHNIGEDILFWGFNSSSTISSQDLPRYKGNHIYFTDFDYSVNIKKGEEEDSDVGVFKLEDGTIQSLPGFKCHHRFLWPPPVWVKIGETPFSSF